MTPTRLARNVSTAAVAAIAAWSSWSHMVHVALRYGERPEVAYVLPISVDGMLVVASAAMVEDKRHGRPVRWSARIAFAAGMGASVAANVAAAHPSTGARIVAAWPAVALLLVVEMLSGGRSTSGEHRQSEPPNNKEPVDQPKLSAGTATAEAVAANDIAVRAAGTAAAARQHVNSQARPRGLARSGGRSRSSGGRTAEAVARLSAERPDATPADIAAEIGVSERHVRRLMSQPHRPIASTALHE